MSKTIKSLMPKTQKHWVGDGFNVNPVFSNLAFDKTLSPFLMFDYGSPKHFPPTKKKLGVGMHPHRGFETVTIAFQGEVEHKDNQGNTGVIRAGDVQWMTAGSGIFHEEFHSRPFASKGGMFEMVQLWVNLPARLKMVTPRYQDIRSADIPQVPLPKGAGHVRVISGSFQGQKGPALTDFEGEQPRGQIQLWDISVAPNTKISLAIPDKQTSILFARKGQVSVAGQPLDHLRACVLTQKGAEVELSTGKEAVSVLLMGGDPILDRSGAVEPIASYGPMVMNTQEEINAAMQWARQEQGKYHSSR